MRRSVVYGEMITFASALRGKMDRVNDPRFSLNPIVTVVPVLVIEMGHQCQNTCLTMLLKPRGRSSESLSEYTEYTLSIEHCASSTSGRGFPIFWGFNRWSFHGIYDAF